MNEQNTSYLLAFDTANEVIAIGLGMLDADDLAIVEVASVEVEAHRASNTQLLPRIDALLAEHRIGRDQLACIVCGRGPGSFTGVRIAMATAKGIASALEVPLYGISTLDALAWNMQDAGLRGSAVVVADAMRKEVYPVRFELTDAGIERLEADNVVKAEVAAGRLTNAPSASVIAGDALKKYAELFEACGRFADEALWTPTGHGLLLAAQAAWRKGAIDPFDAAFGNPAFALPVYTRLSDAEENERIRLSKNEPKNLRTGVQDAGIRRDQRATAHDSAIANAQADENGIVYRPLDAAHAGAVARLEQELMGSDAWSESLVLDELPRKDRVWWAAFAPSKGGSASESHALSHQLVGYAGGWIVDGQVQILKVATVPEARRRGIARGLLARVASDARDLGAKGCSLEVRASNEGAQALYAALGFEVLGTRPKYYSDREDAVIMEGPLPLNHHDVAGMELMVHESAGACRVEPAAESAFAASAASPSALANGAASAAASAAVGEALASSQPLILAIETSCDETAAAIVDGSGSLVSDVVASQIDFHARFGGVVPEIASRKHIEAICGVTDECLDVAAARLEVPRLRWRDLSAVAVTYAPGLVGALVVGVAFAKGAAWALDVPFIGVNHLEGHIYANKIATPDITPPLVVSLVSGGHTMLVHVKAWGEYETMGSTLDDAVGEAFDKVAKAMGLGYPGGPVISKLAAQGDPAAIDFPRAMLHSGDLRFSLSGLKTAVITYLHNEEAAGRVVNKADVAASFQQAVIDVQVSKAEMALKLTGAKEFCLGGGVAANPALRAAYAALCEKLGVCLTLPPMSACTDNAGMIALVALDRFRAKKFFGLDADAHAHVNIDEPY
ncbi:tRNA (adenosine(37)-N6)-threonylcarbamoyltransferase complex transferase subunit TsaD [Raoultibacter phocaeensis]|uniref:tRNA (adenosine(37)-N6)-threonylcarbamoyltransferase complex transferase subunit TsaD n=1 Tax=Raoultibacter phocaeensis TaxID=2479841 RepID=UPI00111B8AC6|nr:tRNA (adenosine(37)-N6)-threonylcarbamoyltransferase complex transferase subunit TsaD [Raoultibacter phocaeensis]